MISTLMMKMLMLAQLCKVMGQCLGSSMWASINGVVFFSLKIVIK